jgi:hypothetical protein
MTQHVTPQHKLLLPPVLGQQHNNNLRVGWLQQAASGSDRAGSHVRPLNLSPVPHTPGMSTCTSPPLAPCQPDACPAAVADALLASDDSLRASQSARATRRSLLEYSWGGSCALAAGTCRVGSQCVQ